MQAAFLLLEFLLLQEGDSLLHGFVCGGEATAVDTLLDEVFLLGGEVDFHFLKYGKPRRQCQRMVITPRARLAATSWRVLVEGLAA